jgi:hypothetical protein
MGDQPTKARYRKKIFMIYTKGCKIIEDVTNRENDEGQGSPEPKPYRRSPSYILISECFRHAYESKSQPLLAIP